MEIKDKSILDNSLRIKYEMLNSNITKTKVVMVMDLDLLISIMDDDYENGLIIRIINIIGHYNHYFRKNKMDYKINIIYNSIDMKYQFLESVLINVLSCFDNIDLFDIKDYNKALVFNSIILLNEDGKTLFFSILKKDDFVKSFIFKNSSILYLYPKTITTSNHEYTRFILRNRYTFAKMYFENNPLLYASYVLDKNYTLFPLWSINKFYKINKMRKFIKENEELATTDLNNKFIEYVNNGAIEFENSEFFNVYITNHIKALIEINKCKIKTPIHHLNEILETIDMKNSINLSMLN